MFIWKKFFPYLSAAGFNFVFTDLLEEDIPTDLQHMTGLGPHGLLNHMLFAFNMRYIGAAKALTCEAIVSCLPPQETITEGDVHQVHELLGRMYHFSVDTTLSVVQRTDGGYTVIANKYGPACTTWLDSRGSNLCQWVCCDQVCGSSELGHALFAAAAGETSDLENCSHRSPGVEISNSINVEEVPEY